MFVQELQHSVHRDLRGVVGTKHFGGKVVPLFVDVDRGFL